MRQRSVSDPCGYPREPLVSYRIIGQLSGWILPPPMIRVFRAHASLTPFTARSLAGLARKLNNPGAPPMMLASVTRSIIMEEHQGTCATGCKHKAWNKGKLIGAKPPLRPKHVWSIRTKLQVEGRIRDLAMFNLAIDSKLRGCDVVALKVEDIAPNGYAVERATVRQKKTGQPVKFELSEQTRQAVDDYVRTLSKLPGEFLFPSRRKRNRPIATRQYARLVDKWVASIGLDATRFGTHSLRRTKASLIYRRTGNLRAVQLLLGHTKIESTVRYLGIEVDDALAIAEQVDV